MSESSYTPGPWAVETTHPPAGSYATVRGADDVVVCHLGLTDEQDAADARLIASAPTLLHELEETAAWLDGRAAVLCDLATALPGGPRSVNADRRKQFYDEAARLRGRAGLIRVVVSSAKGGA